MFNLNYDIKWIKRFWEFFVFGLLFWYFLLKNNISINNVKWLCGNKVHSIKWILQIIIYSTFNRYGYLTIYLKKFPSNSPAGYTENVPLKWRWKANEKKSNKKQCTIFFTMRDVLNDSLYWWMDEEDWLLIKIEKSKQFYMNS
jgi:hypothetical protein